MHTLDVTVCQTVLLHQSDQVEVILAQLPRFQIRWAIFVLVLEVNASLMGLVFPVEEAAAQVACS